MEPITLPNQIQEESPLTIQEKTPNRSKWEEFFSEFTIKQKNQFMRNLNMHYARMIRRHLRKMKEAARKLRESNSH